MNVDAGGTDEHIIQDNFAGDAGDHRIHGNPLAGEALEDAAGGLHNREEHHGERGEGEQLGGGLKPLRSQGFLIEEGQNRLCQHAHADRAGKADEKGVADAVVAFGADGLLIFDRLDGGNRRDKAHGDRQGQSGRNIDQAQNHAGKNAVQRSGGFPGKAGGDHAVDHEGGINEGGKRNDAGADGDRNGDQDQAGHQLSAGSGRIGGKLPISVELRTAKHIADDHIKQGKGFHTGDAQQGAGSAFRHGALHAQRSQRQGNQHPADLFNDLGNRCGNHVLLPLDKTAEGRERTDQADAGRDDPEAPGRFLHTDETDEKGVGQQHQQGKESADADQHAQGYAENTLSVARIVFGEIMSDETGNGDRKAGAGHREQQIVSRKDGLEKAEARVAQNTGQGNGIQDTDDFVDNAGDSQDRDSPGDGFRLSGHAVVSSVNICARRSA